PIPEQEEIRIALPERMAFPGRVGPDQADGPQPSETHGTPASAPDGLVFVQVSTLVEPKQTRRTVCFVVRVTAQRFRSELIQDARIHPAPVQVRDSGSSRGEWHVREPFAGGIHGLGGAARMAPGRATAWRLVQPGDGYGAWSDRGSSMVRICYIG